MKNGNEHGGDEMDADNKDRLEQAENQHAAKMTESKERIRRLTKQDTVSNEAGGPTVTPPRTKAQELGETAAKEEQRAEAGKATSAKERRIGAEKSRVGSGSGTSEEGPIPPKEDNNEDMNTDGEELRTEDEELQVEGSNEDAVAKVRVGTRRPESEEVVQEHRLRGGEED